MKCRLFNQSNLNEHNELNPLNREGNLQFLSIIVLFLRTRSFLRWMIWQFVPRINIGMAYG